MVEPAPVVPGAAGLGQQSVVQADERLRFPVALGVVAVGPDRVPRHARARAAPAGRRWPRCRCGACRGRAAPAARLIARMAIPCGPSKALRSRSALFARIPAGPARPNRRRRRGLPVVAEPGDEAAHPLGDRDGRAPVDRAGEPARVSAKVSGTSPGCSGSELADRRAAERALERGDEVGELDRGAVADVVEAERRVRGARGRGRPGPSPGRAGQGGRRRGSPPRRCRRHR